MKANKQMVIWGAGKIGRGFIGDLFDEAGYKLVFVDVNKDLVEQMRVQNSYTLYHLKSETQQNKRIISDFTVLHTDEKEEVQKALLGTSLMALSLFPNAFDSTARQIAAHLEQRKEYEEAPPLQIIICANIHHPAPIFASYIEKHLSSEGKKYFSTQVALIESLVIRMAVPPKPEMIEEDPLVIMTNGYEELTVDGSAFLTEYPSVPGLRFSKNIHAEEVRKMYTYNMVHAVFAYTGNVYGHLTIAQALQEKAIMTIVHGALKEIGSALIARFGFSEEEMAQWNQQVIENMSNPILGDTIARVGADPKRKLAKNDRLIGPALICREEGIYPYYLSVAIASAFLYANNDDAAAVEIQDYLSYYSVKQALAHYCGISDKPELVSLIAGLYARIKEHRLDFITEEQARIALIAKAYAHGFMNEKTIKGCAQCLIKSIGEITNNPQNSLFKAASGLSGGIAITGDGSCGGYTGGVMLMGSYKGRRLDHLKDGDKIEQYTSYYMAQDLHDRFEKTYGSVTCSEIHKTIFDRFYCLRTKAVRNEFEEAGAHKDKCTTVIAAATAWVAELLMDYKIIDEQGAVLDELSTV